jgi:hypothetical protein
MNGQSSGNALYGTSTVTGTGPFSFTTTLKGYLGGGVTGTTQTSSGTIAGGVLMLSGNASNVVFQSVTEPDGTPIGFVGKGEPTLNNPNDDFVIGLNATTTAPKSVAACAGNYTMMVISYNATAVSKSNGAENDGDAQIGPATVTSNGSFSANLTRYADSSDDTLGASQMVTGTVSSSGTMSSVMVQTGQGIESHPISFKFVTVNGLVIGFTGSFKPVSKGDDDTGIIIGIRGSYTPLSVPPTS